MESISIAVAMIARPTEAVAAVAAITAAVASTAAAAADAAAARARCRGRARGVTAASPEKGRPGGAAAIAVIGAGGKMGRMLVEAVAAADEFLAGDHAPALRRLVLEGRAGVARALKAQAYDVT